MSRRKQSNPKPLKVEEEEWSEEAGRQGEKQSGDSQEVADGNQKVEESSGENDSPDHQKEQAENENPPKEGKVRVPEFPVKRESSMETDSAEACEEDVNQEFSLAGNSESGGRQLGLKTEESEDRGKSRRESQNSGSIKSPELPEAGGHEGSRGGSLSSSPISSHQLLQGLPSYLHLLPPSIRNDFGRLLFLPPILPAELGGNSATASNGPGDLEKGTGESSRNGSGFFCKPCGIKFSSARTLEAHQTYYCSFRREPGKAMVPGDMDQEKGEATGGGKKRERESGDEDRELMSEESMEISAEGRVGYGNEGADVNPNKMAKTGKLYACMYCSYSADKKVSLNRHMRMHSGSNTSAGPSTSHASEESGHGSGSTTPVAPNLPALDRYCQECDIQFSSIKTFRVHKQYYCRTRHVMKAQQVGAATGSPPGGGIGLKGQSSGEIPGTSSSFRKNSASPAPSDTSPASTPGPISSQPFIVLPTNPMIVVPYCFIQAATILPGNVMPSQNALVVLPNGSVQGLPCTSFPVSIPSPSPMSSVLSHPHFPSGISLKNGGTTINTSLGCNISALHSIFNDPKDIIRKMSTASKVSSRNEDSDDYEATDRKNRSSPHDISTTHEESENQSEEKEKNRGEDDSVGPALRGDEGLPAIDLTFRKTKSTKQVRGEDEKENQRVYDQLHKDNDDVHMAHSPIDSSSGRRSSEFQREILSPSERPPSVGGGSCGKRTPRPSSASISSSCSTPPTLAEPRVNGMTGGSGRLSPTADLGANTNSKGHPLMRVMMSPSLSSSGKEVVDFSGTDGSRSRQKVPADLKGKRGKISHIAMPGGAILSTAGGQALTDLLNPAAPAEFNEMLTKISPHLRSPVPGGPPVGLNPALIQALSEADPEMLVRMLDPNYLSALQQNIQLQQQQQHHSGKRGYSKCIECDIVFYKHENYLVHKEHYCAARLSSNGAPAAMQSSRKDSLSRVSICSSPVKSEPEEESQGSSTSRTAATNQANIKSSRKSTDSCSSDFLPLPVYEKAKSRSPQATSCSVSISPVPTDRKEKQSSNVGNQFPCVHCSISYSTLDNLKAHQAYYCMKLRNMKESATGILSSPDDVGVKLGREMEERYGMSGQPLSGNNKGLIQCGKCNLAIPEHQLEPHIKVCLGNNGSVSSNPSGPIGLLAEGGRNPGWKCPCCDIYSPTVSQAQKHLESCHNGVKGFKCLLCGYRGNTLRGMRTHCRSHFDKRVTDLLEGEYMTCITVNDVDHNVTATFTPNNSSLNQQQHESPTTSRQAPEKSKLNHLPPNATSSPGSPSILESQPDIKPFPDPEATMGMEVDKFENNNRVSKCTLCTYTSSFRGNIIRHMKLVHKIPEGAAENILAEMNSISVHFMVNEESHKLNSRGKEDERRMSETVSNNVSHTTGRSRRNINGQEEEEGNCTSPSSSAREDLDDLHNNSTPPKKIPCAVKYCNSGDIHFNHLSTFDAHKKSYCSTPINSKSAERAETPVQ